MSIRIQKYKILDNYTASFQYLFEITSSDIGNLRKISFKYDNQYIIYDEFKTKISGILLSQDDLVYSEDINEKIVFSNYYIKETISENQQDPINGDPTKNIDKYTLITQKIKNAVQDTGFSLANSDVNSIIEEPEKKITNPEVEILQYNPNTLNSNKYSITTTTKQFDVINPRLNKNVVLDRVPQTIEIQTKNIKSQTVNKISKQEVDVNKNKNIILCNLNNFKLNVENKNCTDDKVILGKKIKYRYITYYIIKWVRIKKDSIFADIISSREISPSVANPINADLINYYYTNCGVIATSTETVIVE